MYGLELHCILLEQHPVQMGHMDVLVDDGVPCGGARCGCNNSGCCFEDCICVRSFALDLEWETSFDLVGVIFARTNIL